MYLQRTVKHKIECQSIGLHSGRKVNMTIKPGGVNEGIIFLRRDLSHQHRVRASLENVLDTTLATTIGNNGTAVSTVEHLLSALNGIGVDNAIVELDAPEVPIMDGSAFPFVQLLKQAGTRIQGKRKKILVIKKVVAVTDGNAVAMLLPSPDFRMTCKIDFTHPAIGQQAYHLCFSNDGYEKDISPARTFGFLKDVEYMQAKGLALGGSLRNAVVLDEKHILNKEGLRFADEFVKHKILDAVGDLSLLGMPIIGHFVGYRSGHRLNNHLLNKLLASQEHWQVVTRFSKEHMRAEFFSQCRSSESVLAALASSSAV